MVVEWRHRSEAVGVVGLPGSVLIVIVRGQVEGTDLQPVAVHKVFGLPRRALG